MDTPSHATPGRQRLRAEIERLDEVLEQCGLERPEAATLLEHLGRLASVEAIDGLGIDACALIYAPHCGEDELVLAAQQAAELSSRLCAIGALPATVSTAAEERPSADAVDAPARPNGLPEATDGLFPPGEGANPQLGETTKGVSSARAGDVSKLLIAMAVVASTAAIILWPVDEAGEPDPAEHYRLLLHMNPQDPEAHRWLAAHYLNEEDYDRSLSHYEQVIQIAAQDATAVNNLAWILLTHPEEGKRNPRRAQELAKRAVKLSDRKAAYILDTLAVAMFQNGYKDKGIEIMRELLTPPIRPRDVGVYKRHLAKMQREDPPGTWGPE